MIAWTNAIIGSLRITKTAMNAAGQRSASINLIVNCFQLICVSPAISVYPVSAARKR